jgi:hypothetical protein
MRNRWFDEMSFEDVERDAIIVGVLLATGLIGLVAYLIGG